MTEELESPWVIQNPDALQTHIQKLDDEYFAAHPADDYYIRNAIEFELAMGGYPDYKGLMLVWAIEPGTRMRRPVPSVDDAVEFMVRFESTDD